MTAPVSSSSSDSSAAAAAAAAEAARRAIEAAAREAARRAEQAREQAKAQAKPPRLPPALSRFVTTPKPKVELDPKSKQLSPEQTQAYVTAAKAITKKDPSADPHELIAQNPDLVSWIEKSSRDLEGARGRSAAYTITDQQTELDSRLVVTNGYAMLADNAAEATALEKNPIMDPDSARAALQPLMPNDTGPSAQERAQAAKAAELGKRLVEASKEAEAGLAGSGYCATGVSNALAKLGIEVGGNGNEIDNNLPRDQFKQVDMSLEDALKIPGAILTWEKTSTAAGSLYGHTAITWGDGHTSSSDFTEADTVAGSTGRTGLKVFVPTGMALDGQQALSPADSLTASKVSKIMPDVSADEARRLTPVLKDAMTAAKIEKPESAAAFMAMMAQGTKQFSQSEPEAMQFIVDSAKTWRENGKSLDKAAQAGQLNAVAKQLGVDVPKTASASSDPSKPQSDQDWLRWGAEQIGVEPMELAAIISRESGFDPNADNGMGYHGLIQMGDGAQGETGYDPATDGTWAKQMPKVVDYFKGRGFDGSQYSDPEERTMRAYATVLGGNPDAIDSSDGNGSPRDVVSDMLNPGGQFYDAAKDFMGSNTSAWGGKSQVGQTFYDRGLQAFGASQPDGAGAAPASTSASSSGAVSSASGVSSAPSSSASSPTASAPQESAATQQVDAVQRQAQSYGYDIGQQNLAAILQLLNGSYDAILSGLSDDPEFASFVKSQPGMKNWRPGRPVPKAMVAAFLAKKMKGHGVKANDKGELVDKKGHALDGWKDASKALGLEGSAPSDEPLADPFALDNPFVVDGSATPATALNPVTRV